MNTIIICSLYLLYAGLAVFMLYLTSQLQKERKLSRTLSEQLDKLHMSQERFGEQFMDLRDAYVDEFRKNIKSYRSRHGLKQTASVEQLRAADGAKEAYTLYSNALVDYIPEFNSKYYVVGYIEMSQLILGCDSFASPLSYDDVMKLRPTKMHRRKYPSYEVIYCNNLNRININNHNN